MKRIKTAKDQEGWKKLENKFAIAAAALLGTGHQRRRRNDWLCVTPDADTMQSVKMPGSTGIGEKFGESLTEHIFTLVLRAILLVKRRNNDPELREGLPTDEDDPETCDAWILDRVRSYSLVWWAQEPTMKLYLISRILWIPQQWPNFVVRIQIQQ